MENLKPVLLGLIVAVAALSVPARTDELADEGSTRLEDSRLEDPGKRAGG